MAYTRVNWENLPSTNTPVNATNLNKMDAGIANAVEKTGDTMTGALNFKNTSNYEAIVKERLINNTKYTAKLGVGGNGSVRLERNEGDSSTGTSLEIRNDGLYNGSSGNRLVEVKTKRITDEIIGDYGNVPLGLTTSSAIVLAVNFDGNSYASCPSVFNGIWYCYVIKNQSQSTLNLQQSGTISGTVYYIEI